MGASPKALKPNSPPRPTNVKETLVQKIHPCLWFNGNAEEAVGFYTSVFKNSNILNVIRYGKAGPGPEGAVMTIAFRLEGQVFLAINGGPRFTFTPALSLVVSCETQKELDALWRKLSAGGRKIECGWLQDKFGLTWQITPSVIPTMMKDKDPERRERVMKAILGMKKLDIKTLKRAYAKS
jgi:predicted 3-demethylubiquinone-9 3-methyltransferase (glyoxalase superfamily)